MIATHLIMFFFNLGTTPPVDVFKGIATLFQILPYGAQVSDALTYATQPTDNTTYGATVTDE